MKKIQAGTKLPITITETDIRTGRPHCADNCPIARAVIRSLKQRHFDVPPAEYISVAQDVVFIGFPQKVVGPPTFYFNLVAELPKRLERFIDSFDADPDVRIRRRQPSPRSCLKGQRRFVLTFHEDTDRTDAL